MRPSISVTLEPGLEQGVPRARDLYTFVTSAAGHMMKTLQKPWKNRPSKRQVNHRRFLHNMIQRKFADIEAANHRLASALYLDKDKDEEKTSSLQSEKQEADSPPQTGLPQDPEKCSIHLEADDISKSSTDVSIDPHHSSYVFTTEVREREQHLLKPHSKSLPTTCTTVKDNPGNGRKKKGGNHKADVTSVSSHKGTDYYHRAELLHTKYYNDERPSNSINSLSGDPQTALQNSNFIQLGQNTDMSPSFSPELSLDSCDFSIQMFTDISTCPQAQKSVTDIGDGPWVDIMDLFSVGDRDLEGCMDIDTYIDSICAWGQEVGSDGLSFADQSDFTERMCCNTSEVEDLQCDRGECRYEYGYSWHGDQGSSINHAAETQFNHFQGSDITPNQLPTSISGNYNVSHLPTCQRPTVESPCMLVNYENNLNFTPFEGIAQSFSATLHSPEHRPIPTPPHEDDWPFADILKERT